MSRLLLVHSSREGHSAKIASRMATQARGLGHEVVEAPAQGIASVSLQPFDAVLVVASVHAGSHGRDVEAFVRAHREWLSRRASAFFSVSLSAASESEPSRAAAQGMLEDFLKECGWQPELALPLAGALPYSKYGFLKRAVLRAKSRGEGGPTDTSRDYEFTDWEELNREVEAFLARIAAPLPRLRALAAEVWVAEGPPVPFLTIPYPTRMTVIRLSNGRLWVCSPCQLDAELQKEIDVLGTVEYLVSPNKIHHLFLGDWAETWPGARLYPSPGLAQRRSDLDFDAELGDVSPAEWADEIDQVVVRGSLAMEEVLFFHRDSKTLIVTDLIQRFEPSGLSRFQRLLMRLDGMLGPDGSTPREWRLSFWNRKAARRALRRALAWSPQRIVIAHGSLPTEDGVAALQRGLRWLLGNAD